MALIAPPLVAATAVGSAAGGQAGKFAKHKVVNGLGQKLGSRLPPGSAGIVAIYDLEKTDTVEAALVSAVKKSTAQIDGGGATQLKAALAEAQAGMGG